jgi:hypothetical protein
MMTAVEAKLKLLSLTFVPELFWQHLTQVNINGSITSDVLHRIIGGIIPHVIDWLTSLAGEWEIDAQIACMPPVPNVCNFAARISGLTKVSGHGCKESIKQLLGCLIGIPSIPKGALHATCTLLDFVHLAQYPVHTTTTLSYLEKPWMTSIATRKFSSTWASAKACPLFILDCLLHTHQFSLTEHFKIPKLHSLKHYCEVI